MRHAVIMAGGVGSRLWPMSRQATPKQFQKLVGDQTLLQQVFDRINKVLPAEQIWVMTGEQYSDLVTQQLPGLKTGHLLTEPCARNTAAATALATLHVLKEDPEAVMFGLLPADHYVGKVNVFVKVTNEAFRFLEQNPEYVVTMGIRPNRPTTAYGYIELGDKLASSNGRTIFKVGSFHEKPDAKTADEYLASGQYLWNGGYFLFNGTEMIKAYRQLAPKLLAKIERYFAKPDPALYASLPKEPFDVAIVEKMANLAVIPAEMNWSDIGDWAALHEVLLSEGKINEIVTNHVGNGSENTLVMGGSKLIATVGLKDVVVIDTDDIILICHKDSVQDVKKVVEKLQEQGDVKYL